MSLVLELKKETYNKIRWDKFIGNTSFKLFIPKWRAPNPKSREIEIEILPQNNSNIYDPLTIAQVKNNPKLKHDSINANLTIFGEHSRTVRYNLEGNENMWEVGSVYIPI